MTVSRPEIVTAQQVAKSGKVRRGPLASLDIIKGQTQWPARHDQDLQQAVKEKDFNACKSRILFSCSRRWVATWKNTLANRDKDQPDLQVLLALKKIKRRKQAEKLLSTYVSQDIREEYAEKLERVLSALFPR